MSIKWHIEKRNVASISEWDKNPRKLIKKKLEDLKKSISKFGMCEPIVINTNGSICGGHGRKKALIELKVKDVDCYVPNRALTDKEFEELNIRLNANIAGEFDNKLLSEYFKKDDLIEWGIDNIDFIMPETSEDDFEIPETIKTDIKLGDIFQIGNHRLLCGDSTKKEDVERLMNGEKADMVFTDPPYNIGFKGSMSNTTKDGVLVKHKGANQKHDEIKNDKMSDDEFNIFMCDILKQIQINNKGAYYITFGSQVLHLLLRPLNELGIEYKSIIIWRKNQATLSGKDYKSCYEPIVYGCPPNSFYGERFKQEDIWEFQRTLKNDLHPTMKPIPLIENALKNSSRNDDTVLDLFLGSGSTMVACEQLNRKCYGIEISPEYCQVIIDRMKKAFPLLKIEKL